MTDVIDRHILGGINVRSALMSQPFPFLEFYELARGDRFAELRTRWMRDLPREEPGWNMLWHPDQQQPDGTFGRLQRDVEDLDEDLAETLKSDAFRKIVFDRVETPIPEECYPFALLVDDAPGYWIRKHPDTSQKIVTFQWYFGQGSDPDTMGTRMCHGYREEYDYQVPWVPNCGFAFRVSPESVHEVRQGQCPRQRRSIQVIWYRVSNPSIKYVE